MKPPDPAAVFRAAFAVPWYTRLTKALLSRYSRWRRAAGHDPDYPQTLGILPFRYFPWRQRTLRVVGMDGQPVVWQAPIPFLKPVYERLCGWLIGHEVSRTERGYGGGPWVDCHCRWCDRLMRVPLDEDPWGKRWAPLVGREVSTEEWQQFAEQGHETT